MHLGVSSELWCSKLTSLCSKPCPFYTYVCINILYYYIYMYILQYVYYIYIVDFHWTFPIAISNPQPGAGQLHDLRCPIAEAKEKDSGRVHRRWATEPLLSHWATRGEAWNWLKFSRTCENPSFSWEKTPKPVRNWIKWCMPQELLRGVDTATMVSEVSVPSASTICTPYWLQSTRAGVSSKDLS